MPPGIRTSITRNTIKYNPSAWVLSLLTTSLVQLCLAAPSPVNGQPDLSPRGNNNPLNIDWDPAPAPEDGPPLSRGALRDPAYLPAQIGGIVGSYAVSLVIVAILLLVLSKGRRQALINADLPEEDKYLEFNPLPAYLQQTEEEFKQTLAQFHGHEQGEQFHQQQQLEEEGQVPPPLPTLQIPQSPYRNWGFGQSPLSASRSQHSIISVGSPTSTVLAAGYDLSVDQTVIRHDRAMAQQQLEEMYKHVMEQEEAKAEGRQYIPPHLPRPSVSFASQQQHQHQQAPATPGTIRKNKPSNLNLSQEKEEKQSRGSSLLNFLKSPKKNKAPQGLSISSPIMTPMSGTFPRGYHPDVDGQEMNAIPPRNYAPAKPPPIPSDVLPFRRQNSAGQAQYPTPDISPVSTQSIDQRIDVALHRPPTRGEREGARSGERLPSHVRDTSAASNASSLTGDAYLADPPSAVSERSTSGLVSGSGTVGLPSSPRPGVNRFPSLDSTRTLPSSPKPGASFSSSRSGASSLRANAPAPLGSLNGNNASSSAVRAGGALPLRAYEPSLASPTSGSQTTKQTVFTRQVNGPLSPGMSTAGLRTPWTGAPVPYSPYQPFSPVVPITPSLVTKADRKRMRKFEPKTPTVEMVRSEDDIW